MIKANQCIYLTKEKKQCRNTAQEGSTGCHLHGKKPADPWIKAGSVLPKPHDTVCEKLVRDKLKKLDRAMSSKKSSSSSTKECIYVFQVQNDTNRHFYKVGMTDRDYKKRMLEWSAKMDGAVVEVVDVFYTPHADRVERVIHAYLDHIRCYRYARDDNDEGKPIFQKTVWKRTLQSVFNDDDEEVEQRVVAMEKQIEWFYTRHYHKDIVSVIKAVVDYVKGKGGKNTEEDQDVTLE